MKEHWGDIFLTWVKAIIISLLAIFAPIKALFVITSTLIVIDTITGIIAAKARKEKITSRSFGRIIVKLLLYNLFIIAAFLIEQFILENAIQLTRIGVAIIALTEFFSIMENIESSTGISFKKIKYLIQEARYNNKEKEQ